MTVKKPRIQRQFHAFNPKAYLHEYYRFVGKENREILNFHIKAYSLIFTKLKRAEVLEFGGGPTIYQLIYLAKFPVEIDFSDYLDKNLDEVKNWLHDKPEKFDWNKFIQYVLKREGGRFDLTAVNERANLIRQKMRRFIQCDANLSYHLKFPRRFSYDIVSVNFVPESITDELHEWSFFMNNILNLVKKGGYLVMCALVGAEYYRVGDKYFPATPLSSEHILSGLKRKKLLIQHTHFVGAEHYDEQGYEGIFMVLGKRV